MRKWSLLLVVLLAGMSVSVAQESPTQVFEYFVVNVSWSSDSETLVFQDLLTYNANGGNDIGVQPETSGTWHTYHVTSGQLTDEDVWPLQPALTPEQVQLFEIVTDDGQISFVFPSPNGRYIVYAAQKPPDWQAMSLPVGLADLQTGEHIIFTNMGVSNLETFSMTEEISDYTVLWSADSGAFTIETRSLHGSAPRVNFVSNYATSVHNATSQPLHQDGVSIGGVPVYATAAHDFSSSGRQVLLQGPVSISPPVDDLFIWDPDDPTQSRIVTSSNIIQAMFSPLSDNLVWYIDETGLVEYNLSNDTATVLDPAIKSTNLYGAWFSPDGQYVAVLETVEQDVFYVYDIGEGRPVTN